jgi:hypothetical protein
MATSVTISYDALAGQFVAGTLRVTAGLKNGITIPPTIDNSCRIIYSSDLNNIARLIQEAPVTSNPLEFYDTQGTRFCTLAKRRKDNTFGSVTNVSTMPNLLSNIKFPEVSPTPTFLALSCYPGLHECTSFHAKKSFLEQDMKLLDNKYFLADLTVFTTNALYNEVKEIVPTFWSEFNEVLIAPSNLAAFITEYVCGRYVTEKVSHSQHTITFGSKVLTAQFFNSSVKAVIRTEGVQISTWGTVETNFIVLLDNPDENDIVVTDKATGTVFQPTQMCTLDPTVLHALIAANKFYMKFPTIETPFQKFCVENSSELVKYMFCSPLKVFDLLKGSNELDKNIITFAHRLYETMHRNLTQFLQLSHPSTISTFSWGGVPPAPQLDLMLGRQYSCAAAPSDM